MKPVAVTLALAAVAAIGLLALDRTEAGRDAVQAVTGQSADSVFDDLRDGGLPITEGQPADSEFASLAEGNRCEDSRSFVRSDADEGWGLICLGLSPEDAAGIADAFDGTPALLGPLYADAEDGEIIVFGLGWPEDASGIVHDALGDPEGTYIGLGGSP